MFGPRIAPAQRLLQKIFRDDIDEVQQYCKHQGLSRALTTSNNSPTWSSTRTSGSTVKGNSTLIVTLPYMTLSATAAREDHGIVDPTTTKPGRPLGQPPPSQSRELDDGIPKTHDPLKRATVSMESPVAKSWAHFLAGGSVILQSVGILLRLGGPLLRQAAPPLPLLIRSYSVGGMTSAFLTSPLDVLKTRLQSDYYQAQLASSRAARGIGSAQSLAFPHNISLHVRETFQILFSIHRVEGWRALFKGLGPNLTGVVPARAINFYTYGNGKRLIGKHFNDGHESAWVHLCAAASAGIVTGTATNPIWLVKTRLQLDKSQAERTTGSTRLHRRYKNSLDCVRQVLRQEGVTGLYRGLSASYLGVSESTIQWVLYEQMKMYLARRERISVDDGRRSTVWDRALGWGGKLGAAGTAKLFAAVATYPHEVLSSTFSAFPVVREARRHRIVLLHLPSSLDLPTSADTRRTQVVRTRLRLAPTENGQMKYTGLMQCFRLIWKEEGMAGMYGGLTPHLLRVVPSAAIMFGTYVGLFHVPLSPP